MEIIDSIKDYTCIPYVARTPISYSIALPELVIIICFQNPFGPCPYVQVSNVCKYCTHSLYYYNKRKKGRRNDIVEIEEEKL